ncbi:MAG: sigma-70 family RNA polymerase sigma factor [Opitutales bacterium]|jgi:RNA polymerase sigma-70 factor, ECF subfamily|nr:sigma-70 family RNA polymerase sigma factor [Opitutales bacterium]
MSSSKHDSEIVTLLTQHQQAIRLYVESLMPGDSASDDVVQETNTIIWDKREDFELGTNFKAWSFSIAHFQVRKYRYRQSKNARLVFCEELEDTISEELPAQLDHLSDHQHALQKCIQKLRPNHRELLHHRYFEKTTLESYSATAGRSVGVLKVTLHRIRNNLQRCIEKQLKLEGESQA